MKPTSQKTAALYARFSSDLQKDRSIDDQLALCATFAKREGIKVATKFSDRAKSGSTLFDRDGLLELMTAAKRREFNVVIVESLDRLSRDQEDLAGLFKRLKHYEIDLQTVNEGIATDIHVGLRGIMGSLFLKDLAAKIKRGQGGRVLEGNVPGVVTYGYDRVLGKPGERVINQDHAKIIRRIFTEYANGTSPRQIAAKLTRDRIPTPNGGTEWNHQCFVSGGGIKKGGMLGNRLYIGELIWNKHLTVRDPDTGSASRRARPQSDHITVAVPNLRIIDQKLWDAAQAVRAGRSFARVGARDTIVRRPVIARSQHLLAGLLRCGVCNGPMIISKMSGGKQYSVCSAAHQRSTCAHRKTYIMDTLKDVVLGGMRDKLTNPESIKEMMKARVIEFARLVKESSGERLAVERQINRLNVQINRLVDAIENSNRPVKEIMASMEAKEAERVGLVERVKLLGATNAVTLHPTVVAHYRDNIEELYQTMIKCFDLPKVRAAFHNLIERVVVHPTEYRAPYEVSVYGRLSAIMGVDLFPTMRSNKEILAEEGLSCGDNVNQG